MLGLSPYSFIGEQPLVLEPTSGIGSLKGSDPHDEVINKFYRNLKEASFHIVVPFGEDNEVFFGALDIIRVEDDLTIVDIGHKHILEEGDVPHVVSSINDFRGDVELH